MGSHSAYPPLHTAEHLLTRLLHQRLPALYDFSTRLKSRKGVLLFAHPSVVTEQDREWLEARLQEISEAALPVTESFLTRAEAEARLPNMYQVPEEAERIRVIRVGEGATLVDERACIGEHVPNSSLIRNARLPTLREEEPGRWRITFVVD